MMENEEFIKFLKNTLVKIENAIYLMDQNKHIPAYNKMLGVQQKLACLREKYQNRMFSQLIIVRSVISYFMNGRYDCCYEQIFKLKKELINICIKIEKNERDRN